MPTNLKNLLSRSRSRNELKSREKEDNEPGSNENSEHGIDTDVGNRHNEGTLSSSTSINVRKLGDCCSHRIVSNEPVTSESGKLYMSCSTLNNSSSGIDTINPVCKSTKNGNSICQIGFVGSSSSSNANASVNSQKSSEHSPQQNRAMRKCETFLALSNFSRDSTSPTDTFASGTSGKVKVVKDKILSTSSSTLNCLLHSSNRSKLFSSWKLSSNSSTSNHSPTTFPEFFINDTNGSSNGNLCPKDNAVQKSKSQLSIPGNNFGSAPLTPTNRLRRNISINNTYFSLSANTSYSRSSSVASFGWREKEDLQSQKDILCRLCLCNVNIEETVEILGCSCRYCKDCITAYISFEIQEGAEEIACPDATCEKQGVLTLPEIEILLPQYLIEKHLKFCMYREVEKDGHLMWCPTPGCETVCRIQENGVPSKDLTTSKSRESSSANKSLIISCTTCQKSFCAECKLSFHPGASCESFRRKLIKQGKLSIEDEEPFSLDSIKKCPFCHVPIEKDSGCAQMMCKRCKHVFCWYCLASLDDDFLLRHYDKGPCKNKLGHSRASVVWHRAQVIGIFAGFGVLVLLASPLLILAAPCLLCCRCRYCAKDYLEEPPVSV